MNLQLEGSVCVCIVCVWCLVRVRSVAEKQHAANPTTQLEGSFTIPWETIYYSSIYNIMNHQPRDGCVYVHMSLTREGQL